MFCIFTVIRRAWHEVNISTSQLKRLAEMFNVGIVSGQDFLLQQYMIINLGMDINDSLISKVDAFYQNIKYINNPCGPAAIWYFYRVLDW